MSNPGFRFVCSPSALAGSPPGWAGDMLREGEVALLADAGGVDAISAIAHAAQQETVMTYAGALPLVWVAAEFDVTVTRWAQARGPMTLLVESAGALSDEERRRIDRFVAILGRQSE
jgi:hypothetical protein